MSRMTDAEAIAQIDTALGQWFRGEINEFTVLARIAYTIGQNAGTR